MSEIYNLVRGGSPLLVSMPHSGESLGPFGSKMTPAAHKLTDTDWHLPELYSFLADMDVTVLATKYSRYVIDLNRDPSGKSLYPGQNVTELCPTTTFGEEAIYLEGGKPDDDECADRVQKYWTPYHNAIEAELNRIKAKHGYALLWDAHSIASRVPRFFEGQLPDFNLGTNSGESCAESLGESLLKSAQHYKNYTAVLNGRFKGGFITRQYGNPSKNIHAVQLELSQITYMDENYPFAYRPEYARQVRGPIKAMIETMLAWQAK